MPTWNFKQADSTENTILELVKQMGWMFSKLDSKNVKRLDTNETTIKSADGTTYINGPVLEMRDAGTNMRLKMGYDAATGKFVFKLYDASGALTIDLNSLGEAIFKGNIETAKNATIGEVLKLYTPGQTTFNSGIKWMDSDGTTELVNALVLKTAILTTFALKVLHGDMDIVAQDGGINITSFNNDIVLTPGTGRIASIGEPSADTQIATMEDVRRAIQDHLDNPEIYNSHVAP